MNALSRITDKLTGFLSYFGMIGVLAMMVHICADVIARTVFEVSVPATLEMVTRYYMLMLVLLPLAWVEKKRFMIVVEAFSGLFGKLGLRLVDVLVAIICIGVYGVLAISTWTKAMEQFDVGAYIVALDTQIIVWPGYFTLPFGFGLAALVCLIRIPLLLFPTSAPDAA
ncbi:TRAP transporter small permease [Marinobacter shengliensis]|uniref:TRAP transporter small permease n=1 Tax=Marinobacter shengliensis TaxID=1389223 RepID=UPI00257439C0|nr:TRAP transporter small permease [Marinobacter shengliensis]BEH12987.1 C4-dicarboxylate ABC transporter permease [Marinobacter shengliensis]